MNRNGKEEMSGAAILLFGKEPQQFFKRARVRFIRYEGIDAKVGTEMNVIKDMTFNGRILDVVKDSLDFVKSQIKEHTYLDSDGKFTTVPEYPEFAWKELVINAIAHRDYSIKGTDIQIKMFDDRIVVESPGMLPGLVRLNNIRSVHFSRNPKKQNIFTSITMFKSLAKELTDFLEKWSRLACRNRSITVTRLF